MYDLDEQDRRRTDFAGGELVRLANRQDWRFPTVEARLETRITPSGPVPMAIWVVGSGPTDQAFEDRIQAAHNQFMLAPTDMVPQQIIIDLGTVLLQRNYDLTTAESDWLIYEGFWRQARLDCRFISQAGQTSTAIMRLGLQEPMDRATRLTQGLPRYHGQRFDVRAN